MRISGSDTETPALLVLADGTVFPGFAFGAQKETLGEICFNTGMSGYQETLTDPSYAGQIITFTFPHIGIVGCNPDDYEGKVPHASGLVVREKPTPPSNWRAAQPFDTWLKSHNIAGIYGVDTRALTRHIRMKGSQNAAIVKRDAWDGERESVLTKLRAHPDMAGLDLACGVTTGTPYEWTKGIWKSRPTPQETRPSKYHVVAYDFGEKLNILRSLAERGCKVTVVPAKTTAREVLALKPDGIFLSNGPGDPAATGEYALKELRALIESGVPIFGICLGHQLLALALGAKTRKMGQGHRGANHPVKNLVTGAVEITSQNHGFVVDEATLPKGTRATHRSLFDGSLEGFEVVGKPVFAVQYHPESSPGPHDSRYLFDKFINSFAKPKRKRTVKAKRKA